LTRIALLSSEPLRRRMAGIGIRYQELARRLPDFGIEVVLITPGECSEASELGLPVTDIRTFEPGHLDATVSDCDAAITQGQLANDLLLEVPELPTVVDLYDPFLVENLHYADTLGLDVYRNDHATWVLQLSQGDFFLCSCDEQRQFYLGFLAALGRLNPRRLQGDPDLDGLIALLPFGVPATLPSYCPLLPERVAGMKRLLFGGLYDWYDPWPVLTALEMLDEPRWELLFIRNPNPGSTPQRLTGEVETWCKRRGLWGTRVRLIDWVDADRRYDLLREVDLLVTTHTYNLETRLSLRTRFLDALVAGCPVIASDGGAMSRMLREHAAGWVVPPGDPKALAVALRQALEDESEILLRRRAGKTLVRKFAWDQVLAPLVRFCQEPSLDPTKKDFAFRPPTEAPVDALGFRLRRWLRSLVTS